MHQCQSLTFYLFYHHAQYLVLGLAIFRQEHQSCAVLSFLWHGDALQQDKLMWYLNHNTGTVASLVTGFCTAMFHVLQHLQRIVHQLMALASVNIHHHTHTTSIVLITRLVESFLLLFECLKFAICHIILTLTDILSVFGCKDISLCYTFKTFTNFYCLKIEPL